MKHVLKLSLVWLAAVIFPLPLILVLDLQLVDTPMHLFAYDCGIIAYVWWLLTIYLATRPRWLVNRITLPSTYMVHGVLGVLALIAATFHKYLAFSMFPIIKNTGNIAWYLEIFLVVYAILFLSGWLVDRWPFWKHLKSFLEHRLLKHQLSLWLHRLNWLVVVLIWLHVQLIDRLDIPGFRLLIDVYTLVVVVMYLVWKHRLASGDQQGQVTQNERIDDHLQAVTVKLSSDQTYHAGDFYFVRFRQAFPGSNEYHPFSVASAPKISPNEITLLIQRLGDYTDRTPSIKIGTRVQLEGPVGQFDQEVQRSTNPLILYGLGSGIAPLLSLAVQYQGSRPIHLLWTGSQVNDDYFKDQLQSLDSHGVQITKQVHRFSIKELSRILSQDEINHGLAIVVGSASKVIQVRRALRQVGFNNSQISDEHLTM